MCSLDKPPLPPLLVLAAAPVELLRAMASLSAIAHSQHSSMLEACKEKSKAEPHMHGEFAQQYNMGTGAAPNNAVKVVHRVHCRTGPLWLVRCQHVPGKHRTDMRCTNFQSLNDV